MGYPKLCRRLVKMQNQAQLSSHLFSPWLGLLWLLPSPLMRSCSSGTPHGAVCSFTAASWLELCMAPCTVPALEKPLNTNFPYEKNQSSPGCFCPIHWTPQWRLSSPQSLGGMQMYMTPPGQMLSGCDIYKLRKLAASAWPEAVQWPEILIPRSVRCSAALTPVVLTQETCLCYSVLCDWLVLASSMTWVLSDNKELPPFLAVPFPSHLKQEKPIYILYSNLLPIIF